MKLQEKWELLKEKLKTYGSVAVAFSGGVDSTFLLKAAKEALSGRAIAITITSLSFPQREKNEAEDFCKKEGIRQIECSFHELEIEGFASNPPNRCYICKKALFQTILDKAAGEGIRTVAEGSNLDDNGDYRPGLAAIEELGIKSPLRELGFTKAEIRELSGKMGLMTWDKPSSACLASRFVYGETITADKLKMVEEAEDFLYECGFLQRRVRMHGEMARIELLPEDIEKVLQTDLRKKVEKKLKTLGFSYVTIDLGGYRMGSMNRW